ncbi:MAG: hypothetical protein SF182_20545, partial [Deltaproteobacteria bacterium]|nr:hypothetical protein [Deltaproteobacteria bacterium]
MRIPPPLDGALGALCIALPPDMLGIAIFGAALGIAPIGAAGARSKLRATLRGGAALAPPLGA